MIVDFSYAALAPQSVSRARPRPEDDDIWKFEIQTVAYVEIRGYFPFGDDRRPSHQDDRQVKKTSVAGRC